MSVLRYNGVQLKIVKTLANDSHPVMTDDGADYLYTHTQIKVRCVINHAATSDGGAIAPVSLPGLRQKLLQPRKHLELINGGVVVLSSPQNFQDAGAPGVQAQASVDANNGPHPISFNVIEVIGFGTFIADYEIETWIVDAAQADSPIIGHRWEMEDEIDNLYMTTRHVSGTAYFRSDILDIKNLEPDDLRGYLFHPVPTNFQREGIRVRAASNGLAYHYQFRDVEQWLNRGENSPILRIKGVYRRSINFIGFGILPQMHGSITVEAWGNRRAKRSDLANAVTRAAASWGFGRDGDERTMINVFMNAASTISIVEKYARIDAEVQMRNLLPVAGFWSSFSKWAQEGDDFPEGLGEIAFAGDGVNPLPPASLGTRGNLVVSCISQLLTAPGSKPFPANNGRRARDAQ